MTRTAEAHLEGDLHLFHAVEAGAASFLYRTWEIVWPVVVLGHRTPPDEQVIPETCSTDGVPILRRVTGGGAVVLGPGCLNYAIAVSLVSRPDLMGVSESFAAILRHLTVALDLRGVSIGGGTDLVLNGRKVSGNAQRRGRRALLHHGTLLFEFDGSLAARYLHEPLRQPAYRAARTHAAFMGNLPLPAGELRTRVTAGLETFAEACLSAPSSEAPPRTAEKCTGGDGSASLDASVCFAPLRHASRGETS